jgi:selenocysteine-specific elongation factor
VTTARASQRVAVNLGDLHVSELARGDTLVTPGWFEPTQRFDGRLELLPDAPALRHGARVRVHHGTAEVMGRVGIARPSPVGDQTRSALERGGSLQPGARAHVRIRLESPVVAARGDRFVLRRYSPVRTIGGGVILDPAPGRGTLRQETTLAMFDALDAGETNDLLSADAATRAARVMIAAEGSRGLQFARLVPRLGLDPVRVTALVEQLARAGEVIRTGDILVGASAFQSLSTALLSLVERAHDTNAAGDGLPREEARDKLGIDSRLLDAAVERLRDAGRLEGRERLSISGRGPSLSGEQLGQLRALEDAVRAAGLRAPDASELEQMLRLERAAVDGLAAMLVRQKRLVRIGGMFFHPTALDALKAAIRASRDRAPAADLRLDVGTFKTQFDLSRKYAIPLLEYLDRERVTRRVGDSRIVL